MEWSKPLSALALIFMVIAALIFYRLLSQFKRLKEGDSLTNELSNELQKKLKKGITLFVIGGILGVVGTLI
ncbi:hypothetical protein [Bacillus sp. PS06]|uniref:hypothetical protein n=1 Tax=Bacillus sp. PS06 TaxID=2764176 RepID=UPI00177D250D|nr:hypothetical protein [Bacillus sp. PS06]MBD8069578.1 hypothetical protein [Bacillus sp. PS06]